MEKFTLFQAQFRKGLYKKLGTVHAINMDEAIEAFSMHQEKERHVRMLSVGDVVMGRNGVPYKIEIVGYSIINQITVL
jgi:uncharacterized protein (UPF0218 family)